MTPADGSGAVAKVVEAVKDLPALLFSAFAVAAAVLLFVPIVDADSTFMVLSYDQLFDLPDKTAAGEDQPATG